MKLPITDIYSRASALDSSRMGTRTPTRSQRLPLLRTKEASYYNSFCVVSDLVLSSCMLQHYHQTPRSRRGVASKLWRPRYLETTLYQSTWSDNQVDRYIYYRRITSTWMKQTSSFQSFPSFPKTQSAPKQKPNKPQSLDIYIIHKPTQQRTAVRILLLIHHNLASLNHRLRPQGTAAAHRALCPFAACLIVVVARVCLRVRVWLRAASYDGSSATGPA